MGTDREPSSYCSTPTRVVITENANDNNGSGENGVLRVGIETRVMFKGGDGRGKICIQTISDTYFNAQFKLIVAW